VAIVTIIQSAYNRLVHDVAACFKFICLGITAKRAAEIIEGVIDSFKSLNAIADEPDVLLINPIHSVSLLTDKSIIAETPLIVNY